MKGKGVKCNGIIRVGIREDDEADCQILTHFLDCYEQVNTENFEISVYKSFLEMADDFEFFGPPDLLFIDINLQDINGIETCQLLRKKCNGIFPQIIFISYDMDMVLDVFSEHPFGYLKLPVEKKRLYMLLDEYNQYFPGNIQLFYCRQEKKRIYLMENDIIYLFSEKKRVNVVTKYEQFSYLGKLSDEYERLDHRVFWLVHKSYVVNIHYIHKFCRNVLYLNDGTIIPISERYRRIIDAKISEYAINRGE